MKNPNDKIMTIEQAIRWRNNLKDLGESLALTNGCFDLLHRGHIEYLYDARNTADKLIVLLNSDMSIKSLKGSNRPIIPEYDRAYLLAALECVDCVVTFSSKRADNEFCLLKPDVYIKGGDYSEETLDKVEYEVLKNKVGCKFCFIPFVDGYSTSALLNKIKNLNIL